MVVAELDSFNAGYTAVKSFLDQHYRPDQVEAFDEPADVLADQLRKLSTAAASLGLGFPFDDGGAALIIKGSDASITTTFAKPVAEQMYRLFNATAAYDGTGVQINAVASSRDGSIVIPARSWPNDNVSVFLQMNIVGATSRFGLIIRGGYTNSNTQTGFYGVVFQVDPEMPTWTVDRYANDIVVETIASGSMGIGDNGFMTMAYVGGELVCGMNGTELFTLAITLPAVPSASVGIYVPQGWTADVKIFQIVET